MKREHLFRGKTISQNEWIYGGIYIQGDRYFIIKPVRYEPNTRDWDTIEFYEKNPTYTYGVFEVHPETVGEFTGLLDKDKNKIFEGDILEFGRESVVVYWNAETFSWEAKKDTEDVFTSFPNKDWHKVSLGWIDAEIACLGCMTTQIIGNVHDNYESFHLFDKENVIDNWEDDF